jgi:Glycine-rich domain-containing protein-like
MHTSNTLFLSTVDTPTVSTIEIESLRRYQILWLPLVAKEGSVQLIPPPDIAWLWHCHRLAPQHYSKYCETTFNGRIIEANPSFSFVPESNDTDASKLDECNGSAVASQTKKLWQQMYPDESFYLKKLPNDSPIDVSPLIHDYDLLASAKRQTTFLWQVSGERYSYDRFLKKGANNYKKFLQLTTKARKLNVILVPTYQIDVMWHTHILSSVSDYNKDCISIMKSTMYHDDSINDREIGGLLDVSFASTKKLWKSTYGTQYVVRGGMYRGEPPPQYFSATWSGIKTDHSASPGLNCRINRSLVGKEGASSTSTLASSTQLEGRISSSRKPWAKLDGNASDGRPAFTPTYQQSKYGIRPLKQRDHYVLGRIAAKTGYYHIETREAHQILYYRMMKRLRELKRYRVLALCTFGLFSKQMIAEYQSMKLNCEATRQMISNATCDGNLIDTPTILACAGGSCGGKVAISHGGGTFPICVCIPLRRIFSPHLPTKNCNNLCLRMHYFSRGMWSAASSCSIAYST